MKSIILSLSLAFPAFAQAAVCANYAKYFAIKAYHEEVGVVQGSEGIDYSAKLLSERNQVLTYDVAISDNNEDGETWTVNYEVQTQPIANSTKCSLVNIKKLN